MLPRALGAPALLLAASATLADPAASPRKTPRRATPPAPGVISLDLKDVDVRDVLRTFAELEHFNLVIDPEVRGSVTVRLANVRREDALEVILRSSGLARVLVGNGVRAAPVGKLVAEP